MLTLGIESSCDDTACALVAENQILAQRIISQKSKRGIIPEIAARKHLAAIKPLISQVMQDAGVKAEDVDLIAVTRGPGLICSLSVGIHIACGLARGWKKPLVGVNHLEGHLYASCMFWDIPLPALGVIVSGGHTQLVEIVDWGVYRLLGTTLDDPVGEALDKIGRMLGLDYPGGAPLETLAKVGVVNIPFPSSAPAGHRRNFSFSGLKTAVANYLQRESYNPADVAASAQQAAFAGIVERAVDVASAMKSIVLGGGVACNLYFRQKIKEKLGELPIFCPPADLCSDNAAMIAALGAHMWQSRRVGSVYPSPKTSWEVEEELE